MPHVSHPAQLSNISKAIVTFAFIVPALLLYHKASRSGASTSFVPRMLSWFKFPSFVSPLPKDLENWRIHDQFNLEVLHAEVAACRKAWDYLRPIFSSRGYIFYKQFRPPGSLLIATPSDPEVQANNVPVYPYARRAYDSDIQMLFSTTVSNFLSFYPDIIKDYLLVNHLNQSMKVWPARDSLGREVIIKYERMYNSCIFTHLHYRVVADDKEAGEFEIYKTLNTKEMRSDPRNHTIPIVEFIKVEKYTFAVMPR